MCAASIYANRSEYTIKANRPGEKIKAKRRLKPLIIGGFFGSKFVSIEKGVWKYLQISTKSTTYVSTFALLPWLTAGRGKPASAKANQPLAVILLSRRSLGAGGSAFPNYPFPLQTVKEQAPERHNIGPYHT
jgi:hypothetical protein